MTKQDFDKAAKDYDQEFSHTLIGKEQRRLVWYHFNRLLNTSSRCLELNCGTGVDAKKIAQTAQELVATDISSAVSYTHLTLPTTSRV